MACATNREAVNDPKSGAELREGSDGKAHLALVEKPGVARSLRLEDVVGPVLRYGSVLSFGLILAGIGLLMALSRISPERVAALARLSEQKVLHTPGELLAGVAALDPTALISLGLLVLIATPVVRVGSTVVYFAWRRDRSYLAITSFVLLVLLAGFALGAAG